LYTALINIPYVFYFHDVIISYMDTTSYTDIPAALTAVFTVGSCDVEDELEVLTIIDASMPNRYIA